LWGIVIGIYTVKDHEFAKTVFGLFGPLADEHADLGAGRGCFQTLAQNIGHGRGLAGCGGCQPDWRADLFLGGPLDIQATKPTAKLIGGACYCHNHK
jgi:hypothetical protein